MNSLSDLPNATGDEFTYPMYLDGEAIKRHIPHRDAMLFARCVHVLAYDHYTGEAVWPEDSFVFNGHFPGQPILPGVIILEAAAQIAGVGLRAGDPVARKAHQTNVGLLAGIRKCYFKRPVPPNLVLFFELRTRQVTSGVVNVTGSVSCKQGSVATLEFVFAQASPESIAQKFGALDITPNSAAVS